MPVETAAILQYLEEKEKKEGELLEPLKFYRDLLQVQLIPGCYINFKGIAEKAIHSIKKFEELGNDQQFAFEISSQMDGISYFDNFYYTGEVKSGCYNIFFAYYAGSRSKDSGGIVKLDLVNNPLGSLVSNDIRLRFPKIRVEVPRDKIKCIEIYAIKELIPLSVE